MVKIKSKNTQVLTASTKPNADNTGIIYQANTELYVEGNPYQNLVTPETIFNLECLYVDMPNIETITQTQIDAYILEKYPPIQ